MNRIERRFARQLNRIRRLSPILGGTLAPGWWLIRVPLGILLVLGSFLAVLPVFGLWMMPLGLLLLAVDLPVLRPLVASLVVRFRAIARRWGWRT